MLLWFVEDTIAPMDVDLRENPVKRSEILRGFGLIDIAGDARAVLRPGTSEGPGGKVGTVLTFTDTELAGGDAMKVGYFPDKQEWVKSVCCRYWCGKEKGETVTPESVARPVLVPGYAVRMADGQDWHVARAVYPGKRKALSRKIAIGADGKAVHGDVIERYRALDAAAGDFFDAWVGSCEAGEVCEYDRTELVRLAVLGIAANYRVGMAECANLLGLFDEDTVWDAALATISWPTVKKMIEEEEAAQKKTDEAGTPTG